MPPTSSKRPTPLGKCSSAGHRRLIRSVNCSVHSSTKTRSSSAGIQPFCVAAIDSLGVTTNALCYAIAVAGSSAGVSLPLLVQGSAAPVGTVMITQTRFSIQGNADIQSRDGDNDAFSSWFSKLTLETHHQKFHIHLHT